MRSFEFPLALVGQLGRLHHRNDLWENGRKQERRPYRSHCSEGFDIARQPIHRTPQRPDLHPVGQPAGRNEDAEAEEHPMKGDSALQAMDEVGQCRTNTEIGQPDDHVRYEMERDQP